LTSGAPPAVGQSIGSVTIDPSAETVGLGSTVSGQDEQAFFNRGKAEYSFKTAQANLGVLGRFFGASTSSPGATNIAGFIATLALLGVFATFFLPAENADLPDVRKLLLGLISSALAFIFGAASSKKD
jgi:hypothetical protein